MIELEKICLITDRVVGASTEMLEEIKNIHNLREVYFFYNKDGTYLVLKEKE